LKFSWRKGQPLNASELGGWPGVPFFSPFIGLKNEHLANHMRHQSSVYTPSSFFPSVYKLLFSLLNIQSVKSIVSLSPNNQTGVQTSSLLKNEIASTEQTKM